MGFYLWIWQAMAGNLILADGCPTLPELSLATPKPQERSRTLDLTASRISQALGARIVSIASPLCIPFRIFILPLLLMVAACWCFPPTNLPLISLESHAFDLTMNVVLLLALLITTAEAVRLYSTWVTLRKLLHALGRLRLRRTLAQLRPIQSNSIWGASGNVRRFQYSLLTQQLDAANRLINLTGANSTDRLIALTGIHEAYLLEVPLYGQEFIRLAESQDQKGAPWNLHIQPAGLSERGIRPVLADAVAVVYNSLTSVWARETESLNLEASPRKSDGESSASPCAIPLSTDPAVCAAEEFVCFHYIAFIQNIIARTRTITLSMICLFVAVCFAISFYPFVPRTEIAVWMILNLALIASAVAYVYAGMERNEILSYISNTHPGRLGAEFYVKLAGFLAGPFIGVIATQFPSIADTVLQWLQPGLDAMK